MVKKGEKQIMTLQYKDYTITGTTEEILDFIKVNEPITFSNGSTMQYLGKTLSDAISSDMVYKVPEIDETICDKRCKMTFDKEYVEKHFDFFSKYSYVYDAYKKIYRFYLKEGKEHQSFIEGCRNLE